MKIVDEDSTVNDAIKAQTQKIVAISSYTTYISGSAPFTTSWADMTNFKRTRYMVSGAEDMTIYLQFGNTNNKLAEVVTGYVSGTDTYEGHDFAVYGTQARIKLSSSTATSAFLTWNGVR